MSANQRWPPKRRTWVSLRRWSSWRNPPPPWSPPPRRPTPPSPWTWWSMSESRYSVQTALHRYMNVNQVFISICVFSDCVALLSALPDPLQLPADVQGGVHAQAALPGPGLLLQPWRAGRPPDRSPPGRRILPPAFLHPVGPAHPQAPQQRFCSARLSILKDKTLAVLKLISDPACSPMSHGCDLMLTACVCVRSHSALQSLF